MLFGQPWNDLVDKAIDMADVSSGVLNDDVWRGLRRQKPAKSYVIQKGETKISYVYRPDTKMTSLDNLVVHGVVSFITTNRRMK